MEIFDWIADYGTYVAMGVVVLLFVMWFVAAVFEAIWGEWQHKLDTERCEPQKWKRDPFHKIK